MQLCEGGLKVFYPLGLWSRPEPRFSRVVKVLYGYD